MTTFAEHRAKTNLLRAQLKNVDWTRHEACERDDLWSIHLDADNLVPWMAAYVEPVGVGGLVLINSSTWTTLCYDGKARNQFLEDMKDGGRGLRFVVTDAGPYARAVKAEAEDDGSDVVRGKDALTELSEEAVALVLQAASLNAAPTDLQRQAFAVRYVQLNEKYAAITARLEMVRSQIELAGTAVHDATFNG